MLLSAGIIGKALLNTVMGMGTVFIVLIFIAFIISLFKYINRPAKKTETKETAAPVNNVVTQIEEAEELSDDSELVAVITAAIAAYEGASGVSNSGFRVRSIKRANGRSRR